MTVIAPALLALLGLVFGSFFNVLLPRVATGQSIRGRSRCLRCKKTLQSRDLIPLVSWLVLRGQCRFCHRPISPRYPLVEAATALLFVGLYAYYGLTWVYAGALVVASFLLLLFLFDLLYGIVPDSVSLPAAGVALVVSILRGVAWTSLLWGALLGAGFFAIQYLLSRGKWVGDGDIRLGLVTGLALGLVGTVVALVLAYTVGALVSVGLLLGRRARLKSTLPFGSFLTAGTLTSLLFSPAIVHWYFSGGLFSGTGLAALTDWIVGRVYHL